MKMTILKDGMRLSVLKTQFPKMFESASDNNDGYRRIDDGRIPDVHNNDPLTRSNILKKSYAEDLEHGLCPFFSSQNYS